MWTKQVKRLLNGSFVCFETIDLRIRDHIKITKAFPQAQFARFGTVASN